MSMFVELIALTISCRRRRFRAGIIGRVGGSRFAICVFGWEADALARALASRYLLCKCALLVGNSFTILRLGRLIRREYARVGVCEREARQLDSRRRFGGLTNELEAAAAAAVKNMIGRCEKRLVHELLARRRAGSSESDFRWGKSVSREFGLIEPSGIGRWLDTRPLVVPAAVSLYSQCH